MRFFNLIIFLVLLSLTYSCGITGINPERDVVGVSTKKTRVSAPPYGMVYVPSGSFVAGASDEDMSNNPFDQKKTIEVSGFFMDQTEVSNAQYRQFVEWVKDSLGTDNINDLVYTYEYFDYQKAVEFRNDPDADRSSFVVRDSVRIYPDTLVWMVDFPNSESTFLVTDYFSSGQYDNYPVVGVSWRQAKAFCAWKTHIYNAYNEKRSSREARLTFDLPSEWQWEYAARGKLNQMPYPWGGPDVIDSKGQYRANFKTGFGNYSSDGGTYTVPVKHFKPNAYGLYNMVGNVAEWTISTYGEAGSVGILNDLNPTYSSYRKNENRKVARGGSWKDVPSRILVSSRIGINQRESNSFTGFRTIASYTIVKN